MTLAPTVLLVDPDVSAVVALERSGYRVIHAMTAAEAREHLKVARIVLLELDLPDEDGVVLISEIRSKTQAPIMVCTASPTRDRILALKFGADMVVEKPVDDSELVARVMAVERRVYLFARELPALEAGRLMIDRKSPYVLVDGKRMHVTPTELRLLISLAASYGEVVTFDQLAQAVWNAPIDPGRRHTAEIHLGRLRGRLQAYGAGHLIKNYRDFGYCLFDPDYQLEKENFN